MLSQNKLPSLSIKNQDDVLNHFDSNIYKMIITSVIFIQNTNVRMKKKKRYNYNTL